MESGADSISILQSQINIHEQNLSDYRAEFIKKHPDTFLSKVFAAMPMLTPPKAPRDEEGNLTDSLFQWRFLKAHFWDNLDLSDGRFVRTPILETKLSQYMENLTFQQADSLIRSMEIILRQAKEDAAVFKYSLTYLYNLLNKTKIIGLDKAYVHLVDKYYARGKADWIKPKQLKKMRQKAARLKPNMIGNKAPEMVLENTEGEMVDIYQLDAAFTVIVFFAFDCGHCAELMPKYYKLYKKYLHKNVDFYASCINEDKAQWNAYLKRHKYNGWINVIGNSKSNFRFNYDVSSTPKIYVLDKDKNIVTKGIKDTQLERYLKDMPNKEPDQ